MSPARRTRPSTSNTAKRTSWGLLKHVGTFLKVPWNSDSTSCGYTQATLFLETPGSMNFRLPASSYITMFASDCGTVLEVPKAINP